MIKGMKITAIVFLALTMISCADSYSPAAPSPEGGASAISPTPTVEPAAEPTVSPQPQPNLIYEQNGDMVILTIRDIGVQMEFPLEFQHVIQYWPKKRINFNFSKEPFNGEYTESCSSFISIDFQSEFDLNDIQNVDESYTTEKAEDGTAIYFMNKHETQSAVGFEFAREGISCWGTVDVSPAFYHKYENAIMNMIQTMAIVDTQDIAVPAPTPISTVKYERWNLLPVPSFDAAVYIPEGFEKVCTYASSEDFASVSFDFTKPPFNEPVSQGLTDVYSSSICICFYRGIEKKYFEEYRHNFIAYSHAGSDPDLILIDFLKTDKAVNFEAEDLEYEYGGIASVRREFYDKYEDEILDMLDLWTTRVIQ